MILEDRDDRRPVSPQMSEALGQGCVMVRSGSFLHGSCVHGEVRVDRCRNRLYRPLWQYLLELGAATVSPLEREPVQ